MPHVYASMSAAGGTDRDHRGVERLCIGNHRRDRAREAIRRRLYAVPCMRTRMSGKHSPEPNRPVEQTEGNSRSSLGNRGASIRRSG